MPAKDSSEANSNRIPASTQVVKTSLNKEVKKMAQQKANPTAAANLFGARSVGLNGMLSILTMTPLIKLSRLYFPRLSALAKKSSDRKNIMTGLVKADHTAIV